MTLPQLYQARLDAGELEPDQAQAEVVARLQEIHDQLTKPMPRTGILERLPGMRRRVSVSPVQGLYIWGSVGRGKTWLVDLFFNQLPLEQKNRIHFHRLMQQIHEQLATLRGERDPLEQVADRLAKNLRVLCIDEFIVTDIGDAMILAQLLKALFRRGITLITTSNTRPDLLYKDGIQRASFLPAIDLLEQHTEVIELYGDLDYRLRHLEQARVYHTPLGPETSSLLQQEFRRLAPEEGVKGGVIQVYHRDIAVEKIADDLVWFDFFTICGPPRSQADYLELARCFHTVIISNIPVMNAELDDNARRFLYLLDEFYDRRVKLIISAAEPPERLYQGRRLAFDFRRAVSRLQEMRSTGYLASPHRP